MWCFLLLGGTMIEVKDKKFQTVMENREILKLNGVLSIESFGEDYLVLDTELGELSVEGKNLKIESLIKENGDIYITGKINGIFYKEKNDEKSFLRKLFK